MSAAPHPDPPAFEPTPEVGNWRLARAKREQPAPHRQGRLAPPLRLA